MARKSNSGSNDRLGVFFARPSREGQEIDIPTPPLWSLIRRSKTAADASKGGQNVGAEQDDRLIIVGFSRGSGVHCLPAVRVGAACER